MSSEFGYIPESPEQSFGNNKGIFTPTDIYELTRADKYTNYGQLEFIETQTHSSSVSYIEFTDIKQDIYDVHFVTLNDIGCLNDTSSITLTFFESGTEETANVYKYARQLCGVDGTFTEQKSTGAKIPLLSSFKNASNYKGNGYFYLFNAGDSTKYTFLSGQDAMMDYYSNGQFPFMSAVLPQTSTVDGFKLTLSASTFSSFDISLYGIKAYS